MKRKSVDIMKKTRTVPVYVAVMLIIVIASMTFSLTYFFMSRSYYKKYKTYELMAEIEYLINKHYYEEPEDIGELVDMALQVMLQVSEMFTHVTTISKTLRKPIIIMQVFM